MRRKKQLTTPYKAMVVKRTHDGPWECEFCHYQHKDFASAVKASKEGCLGCYAPEKRAGRDVPVESVPTVSITPAQPTCPVIEVSYLRNGSIPAPLPTSGYAHRNDIPGLTIGDIVDVPFFGDYRNPQMAVVVRLGSEYRGPLESVICKTVFTCDLSLRNL